LIPLGSATLAHVGAKRSGAPGSVFLVVLTRSLSALEGAFSSRKNFWRFACLPGAAARPLFAMELESILKKLGQEVIGVAANAEQARRLGSAQSCLC
jgi:hypothetical protein